MHPAPRILLTTAAATLVAASLATPALAVPLTVTGGSTNWQQTKVYEFSPSTVKTWLGYVAGAISGNGFAEVSGGASFRAFDGTAPTKVDHAAYPVAGVDKLFNAAFPVGSGGTVDPEAGTLDVQAQGTLAFVVHGQPAATVTNPRIVLSGTGSGAVHASGTGAAGAISPASALFTLDASQASVTVVGGGKVAISNLVPKLGAVEVFGGSYKAGVAGPDRAPNTFGGFSVLLDTATALPVPPKTVDRVVETVVEKTVEKVVERPVDRVIERLLEAPALVKPVVVRASLTRSPFKAASGVTVTVRKAGTRSALGEGFVVGRKLTVVVPGGTVLKGKYVVTRTSRSRALAKSVTVSVSAAAVAANTTKQSRR